MLLTFLSPTPLRAHFSRRRAAQKISAALAYLGTDLTSTLSHRFPLQASLNTRDFNQLDLRKELL